MAHFPPKRSGAVLASLTLLLLPGSVQAAKPPVAEALKLKPVQAGIDYDVPDSAATEKCSLEPYQVGDTSGWEVRDGDSNVLRRYLDTNADNKVDQWCYFKDGIEVYRDIDSNHNRKADQYRWLGTAGIRWAIDTDEDGRIDRWKVISPEEVTEEAVLAMRAKDADRFKILLLTPEELRDLGLGTDQAKQLAQKLAGTASGFEQLLRTQTIVTKDARWVNFGGTRPGVVPAGTAGSQRDLRVYENVAAVIESGGTNNQLVIGTLVQVGDVWRLVDLPKSISDAQASNALDGFFFLASRAARAESEIPVTGGLSPEIQKLINEMEQIDEELVTANTPESLAPLNAKRADVLEKLAGVVTDEADRAIWIRQLADTVSAAAQSGEYPLGIERLAKLGEKLKEQKESKDLVAYVQYRHLFANYAQSMQQDGELDFAKIQQKWLADLDQFVQDFPDSQDAAEAMLHLALAEEFAGNDDAAVKWYGRVAEDFPETPRAQKASGAVRRIQSEGKPFILSGKDRTGKVVDARSYRGKVVLVHYWATSYTNCMPGLSVLKDMQAKYGKENLALIGINLDNDQAKFEAFVKENPLPWPQLYGSGGFDSSLANQYGIQELPTMILVDKEGNVVRRRLEVGQIDSELRRLLR